MTLLQRDRENIELGRQEGGRLGAKIMYLHLKGMSNEDIASAVHVELDYVVSVITDFELNEQE